MLPWRKHTFGRTGMQLADGCRGLLPVAASRQAVLRLPCLPTAACPPARPPARRHCWQVGSLALGGAAQAGHGLQHSNPLPSLSRCSAPCLPLPGSGPNSRNLDTVIAYDWQQQMTRPPASTPSIPLDLCPNLQQSCVVGIMPPAGHSARRAARAPLHSRAPTLRPRMD